jgi:hypothetical protein
MRIAVVRSPKVTCIIVLLALVALASPVSLVAQEIQKPLAFVFTATFEPKVGLGPSVQYEFQADSLLHATNVALGWAKEYWPQHMLVALTPKGMEAQETYTATLDPRVGEGPSMQYEFQMVEPSAQHGFQADSVLRAIRIVLGWSKEYCPQHILVALLPKTQPPQDIVRVNPTGLVAQSPTVFTATFVSRDSGLAIQQELQAHSFLRAVTKSLAWSKYHFPDYVLLSIVQNQ